MHKFGYGDKFIHDACINIESNVKIHGLLSDPFTPMCVRQWCQLFKLLYNIVAEVLANLINADKKIKRIKIGDHEIKIVNFTDNTTIFLRYITWGSFKKYVCSIAQDSQVLNPLPPCLPLFVFELPPPPDHVFKSKQGIHYLS